MSNCTLSWTVLSRALEADLATRPPVRVREERLRSGAGIRGALALSAWRGRTGRRYVVVVQPLDTLELVARNAAVVLAVARDDQGQAAIVAVRACESGDPGFLGWLAACALRGAKELHAHRLAETELERAAIAADLGGLAVDPTVRVA